MAERALAEFVAEANEILETLGRDLLVLDTQRGRDADPDLLNAVFRAAHSLKGLSSMFGQDRISALAHVTEDVLDSLRLGKIALDDTVLDALVEALDGLQALLRESSSGEETPEVAERGLQLTQRLKEIAGGSVSVIVDVLDAIGLDPAIRNVFTEYEEHRLRENVKKGVGVWKVRAVFALDDFDQRLTTLNNALKPLGEVVSTLPSSQPGQENSIAFDLIFATSRAKTEIDAVVSEGIAVTPLASPLSPTAMTQTVPPPTASYPMAVPASSSPSPFASAPSGPRSESSLRSLTQTVRVDIERLDALMTSIGELLLIRSNIQRLTENATAGQITKQWLSQLQRETRGLERRLDELQNGVLEARMVPLGQVFDKLARLMRRLVRESGKEVDFIVAGGDVELDKLIVEELSDPLMHLLRNALDHGVESPMVRQAHGKLGRGRIRLAAEPRGNQVVITVGDDGAGMDESRIRQVAVERGLVTQEQTGEMDRRELLNLVFLAGFSTREEVSNMSGRGVGLDVVKTNLGRLAGLIDIDSRRGEGTDFILTLPLTLAIIRALIVQSARQTYAVPLNSVLEIVSVRTAQIQTIERREVFEVRGSTLPLVRLSKVFGLREDARDSWFVIVIGIAQQRIGLAVDALVGQQDIVTKPFTGRLQRVPGIAGATDLGDRRPVLVLDVAALMEELIRPQGTGAPGIGDAR